MIYTDEFLNRLHIAVVTAAEDLASNNNYSLYKHTMTVIVDDEEFDFIVNLSVENYEYEESTNSASYDTSVFVVGVPETTDEKFREYLHINFYLETIYEDAN